MAASGLTKNQRRRLKKRAQKQAEANGVKMEHVASSNGVVKTEEMPQDVEIEYVSADLTKELALPQDDPAYAEMMRVFGKFSSAEELCGATDDEDGKDEEKEKNETEEEENNQEGEEQTLSKKARKKSKRLSSVGSRDLTGLPKTGLNIVLPRGFGHQAMAGQWPPLAGPWPVQTRFCDPATTLSKPAASIDGRTRSSS